MAQSLILEAEDFDVRGAWRRQHYGENYYAGTFANTFLSRKAFLGAPEQCAASVATMKVQIPAAGRYLALVRYEAAFRFETRFRLTIEQNGHTRLARLYGASENIKIWPFGKRLTNEVAWDWGASENIVWEGHDAFVPLEAGPAVLTLIVEQQPEPAARRNIDVLMLTTNPADVETRIAKEGYLPLDGLLTQAGDLYVRVKNNGGAALTVTFPPATEHSPYWVHRREWQPKSIACPAGEKSDWMEVGSVLDSLNDGQWQVRAPATPPHNPSAPPATLYDLEFAVRTANGKLKSIRRFEALTNGPLLAYDADTRYSKRIRTTDEVLYELVDYLKKHRVSGTPPKKTLIYGTTFPAKPNDARYTAAVDEFISLLGATALSSGERKLPPIGGLIRDYIDVRGQSPTQLVATCRKLIAEGRAAQIATVSLGDEIGLPSPGKGVDAEFRDWLKARGIRPDDLVAGVGEDWEKIGYRAGEETARTNAGLFYYSNLYRHRYGIQAQKQLTDVLRAALPNAGVGANYSPHHGYFYLGETYKWVSIFREQGMTLPWSEDYIYQAPLGSQQMNFLSVDLFRAGIRNDPGARIHFYVMPHWPGNTPASWRRQFYGDIAHGVKVFNLFEFRPVQAAYTENHCSSPEMYQAIRQAFHELGTFEDIVQGGHLRPGLAGLWFSEAADIWRDNEPPFAAGKRTLYVAVLHGQIPLDVVVEGDDLSTYRILYLTDRHVSRAASKQIAAWVSNGGQLFATAGAGMFDELNQPNKLLRPLFGVEETELVKAKQVIRFEKQDLPFADAMLTATGQCIKASLPVFGAYSRIEANDAQVEARFTDGTPAVTTRSTGRGQTLYCAFMPGLSFFKPALPRRPVDRSSRDDSVAHLVPTNFDAGAERVIELARGNVSRPVLSKPGVESTIIESPQGAIITLNNWSGLPVRKLEVVLDAPISFRTVARASGKTVHTWRREKLVVFTLDLDVADALVLRP